jgi:hypothetical protein
MKILAVILAALMLSGCDPPAWAREENRAPVETNKWIADSAGVSRRLSVVCLDGYRFVALEDGYGAGLSQFWVLDAKGRPVPAKCDPKP